MGTYTSNYNLYMPTVGETGWGTLVNGNFTTIDTTMKGLDTRITPIIMLKTVVDTYAELSEFIFHILAKCAILNISRQLVPQVLEFQHD